MASIFRVAGVYFPEVPIGKRNNGCAPELKNFLKPTLLKTPSEVIIFAAPNVATGDETTLLFAPSVTRFFLISRIP